MPRNAETVFFVASAVAAVVVWDDRDPGVRRVLAWSSGRGFRCM
jgi:hypothetical protein